MRLRLPLCFTLTHGAALAACAVQRPAAQSVPALERVDEQQVARSDEHTSVRPEPEQFALLRGVPPPPDRDDAEVVQRLAVEHDAPSVRLHCEFSYLSADGEALDDAKTGSALPQAHVLDLGPNEEKSIRLRRLRFTASYSDDPLHGASFTLRAQADDALLHAADYRFSRSQPPRFAFGGRHGFTGLVYLKPARETGGYQYFCSVPPEALP